MTTEKVNDLELVSLGDYFNSKKFRLIPADAVGINGGISEVPVIINIHADFSKKLSFDTRNLQKLYGFAIMEEKLIIENGGPYYSPKRKGKLFNIELNDCGELWIMKMEMFDGKIKLYAVRSEDIPPLLNECRKPVLLDVTPGF